MKQVILGCRTELTDKPIIDGRETMKKTIKTHDGVTIMLVNGKVFYPVESIAIIGQTTPEIAKIILKFNEGVAKDAYPDTPPGCLPEHMVIALQDRRNRLALDLATIVNPFNPRMAREIASDLPWGEDYSVSDESAHEYYIKRSTCGLDSVLQKLYPNLAAPHNYDGSLRLREVAGILDLSENQVRGLVSSGKLKYHRTHGERGQFRFEIKSILEYHRLINYNAQDSPKEVS